MPKLIDAFIFFNEQTTLDFRLRYLSEVVDIFVIVESNFTFTGDRKGYYSGKVIESLPRDIARKVRLIKVDTTTMCKDSNNDNWEREFYQRNMILQGLYSIDEDDFIMISDVDEIPNRIIINQLMKNFPEAGGLNICMDMFYYSATNHMYEHGKPHIWSFPKMIKAHKLKLPQTIRMNAREYPAVMQAGWHLSYMGGYDAILKKIKSYAHQENNTLDIISELNKNLSDNSDLFGRNYTFRPYNKQLLPALMQDNELYSNYFLL